MKPILAIVCILVAALLVWRYRVWRDDHVIEHFKTADELIAWLQEDDGVQPVDPWLIKRFHVEPVAFTVPEGVRRSYR